MSEKIDDAFIMKALQEAQDAALKAANAHMELVKTEYPCGFAWVNIKPARGPWVAYMKRAGIGRRDEFYGGWTIWNPSKHTTQNMDAKEAGAEAFAASLKKYGLNCNVRTRMD